MGNLYCGYASLVHSLRGDYASAAVYIGVSFAFDMCDGFIARLTGTASDFGVELDSLADIVSFGVAPAALGFAAGLAGGWDVMALVYFVCCGVSRLARFNVTAESLSGAEGKVAYFEGTPIPTSVLLSGVLALAAWQGALGDALWGGAMQLGPWTLHPLSLMFVLSGTLMISKTLHIPKL
jgi:CDP-diacylglycerol--serine O-phosphatidyltransferase